MRTLASELRPIASKLSLRPRVYVDANVPWGIVSMMRHELEWDVLFALEHDELRRAPDRDHFHRAIDLGRTLITLDHDFADARRFPPAVGPGVIVLSASDERVLRGLLAYVDRTLLSAPDADPLPLRGRTIQVTIEDIADAKNGRRAGLS